MQKVSDPPPASCPECGGGPLARIVSRTTFQLKGGGWYSDLYASPKKKPAAGAGEPTGSPSGPAGGAASESGSPGSSGSPPGGSGGSDAAGSKPPGPGK
jgi:predicted nucleic acid-binding Zn ribbon protein